MPLSENTKLTQHGSRQFIRFAAASAGTYYQGQHVMIGGDDNYAKPLSASVVPGTQGAGIVQDYQVVEATGDTLKFIEGEVMGSGSGFVAGEKNKIAWSDGTSFYDSQGTNRIQFGRFKCFDTSSIPGQNAVFEVGTVPSGSSV